MRYAHERTHAPRVYRPTAQYPPPAHDATAWGSVERYLTARGCNPDLAKLHGWYPSTRAGDGALRIVIPAPHTDGTAYWQARCLVDDEVTPRYLSPSSPRGDGLVVVYPSPYLPSAVYVVVEGPMDALAIAQHGAVGISLMGNRPPKVVWDRIGKLVRGHRVALYPDSDAVGETAGWLTNLSRRGILSEYMLPAGKDFASLSWDAQKGVLAQVIQGGRREKTYRRTDEIRRSE